MSSKQVKEALNESDTLLTVREGFWNMRDSCVKTELTTTAPGK
jgi:hypothetical protein